MFLSKLHLNPARLSVGNVLQQDLSFQTPMKATFGCRPSRIGGGRRNSHSVEGSVESARDDEFLLQARSSRGCGNAVFVLVMSKQSMNIMNLQRLMGSKPHLSELQHRESAPYETRMWRA